MTGNPGTFKIIARPAYAKRGAEVFAAHQIDVVNATDNVEVLAANVADALQRHIPNYDPADLIDVIKPNGEPVYPLPQTFEDMRRR